MRSTAWQILGIAPTREVAAIRRAYADILKRNRPDDDAAAFTALRSAYEAALAYARAAVASASTVELVSSAAADPEIKCSQPDAVKEAANTEPVSEHGAHAIGGGAGQLAAAKSDPVAQLNAAFSVLQQAGESATAVSPESLRRMLADCLDSPALQNVSVQVEFESQMMAFLLRTQPQTETLLEPVIEKWRLRERRDVGAHQMAPYLLRYADNVKYLRGLKELEPRAYRALVSPPGARVRVWLQIVFQGLDSAVRRVLTELGSVIPRSIHPAALAWWAAYFTKPHVRAGLLLLTGALALLGAALGGMTDDLQIGAAASAFAGGAAGLLIGLVITGAWFVLVDWPRHRFEAKRRGASVWVRAGWMPAGIAACLIASFCPDNLVATIVLGTVSAAILAWSVLMAPELGEISGANVRTRLVALVVINAPVVIWWRLLSREPQASVTTPMWVAGVAALLGVTLGQPALSRDFLHVWSQKSRQVARAGIAVTAIGVIALVQLRVLDPAWFRPLLAFQLAVVFAQRIAAANLTDGQGKIRWYVAFYSSLAAARGLSGTDVDVLGIGTWVFMGGVALIMGICLYNDWRAADEEAALRDLS